MFSNDIYEQLSKIPHNKHHLSRYVKFIFSRSETHHYTEKHHILPIRLFPEYENIRHTWNIVKLSAREHFIAHHILSKVFTENRPMFKMLKAFSRMTSYCPYTEERRYVGSKLFELARIAGSEAMKINNPMHNKYVVQKAKQKLKEFYESKEGIAARCKMSQTRIGKDIISTEGKRKLRELWLGVKKPIRQKEHTDNQIKSMAVGIFHTPWGDFYSPNLAKNNIGNTSNLSRYNINKFCKTGINGFSFTDFNKHYKLGKTRNKIQS